MLFWQLIFCPRLQGQVVLTLITSHDVVGSQQGSWVNVATRNCRKNPEPGNDHRKPSEGAGDGLGVTWVIAGPRFLKPVGQKLNADNRVQDMAEFERQTDFMDFNHRTGDAEARWFFGTRVNQGAN